MDALLLLCSIILTYQGLLPVILAKGNTKSQIGTYFWCQNIKTTEVFRNLVEYNSK